MLYAYRAAVPGFTVDPVTLALENDFPKFAKIDGSLTFAVRTTDAIVVRVFRPEQQDSGGLCSRASGDLVPPNNRSGLTIKTAPSLDLTLPGQARTCFEQRFTLDGDGNLVAAADDGRNPRVRQVFRRLK